MLNRYFIGMGVSYQHALSSFDTEGDIYTQTSNLNFAIECLERLRKQTNISNLGYIYDKQTKEYLN